VAAQHNHFDVYLKGKSMTALDRRVLVKKLETLYRLDRAEVNAFVTRGERIRVRRGIDQDAAMKAILDTWRFS
jgi:hypothetical protein